MATEKRLIERIAERLKDAYPQADRNNLCPAIYYDDFVEIVDDVLSEIGESVDAVEVVYGEWRLGEFNLGRQTVFAECSVCNAVFEVSSFILNLNYNYCPNCGARMDMKGE